MRPLNQSDITATRTKLVVALVLAVGLLPLLWWMPRQLSPLPTAALPPTGVVSEDTFDHHRLEAIKQQLTRAAEALQTTNVFVLVDATPGMDAALSTGAEVLSDLLPGVNGSVGAGAYRDAVEGAWAYVEAPSGSDVPRWLGRLSTDVQYDQDELEAVYYGLQQALQSAVFQPEQTNVLILLGDAGNHAQEPTTEVAPQALREAMKRLSIHFAAVQVRHPEGIAYEQFGEQLLADILRPRSDERLPEPVAWPHGLRYQTDRYPLSMLATGRFGEVVSGPALEALLRDYLGEVQATVAERVSSLEAVRAGRADTVTSLASLSTDELRYLQAYQLAQTP
jgi:hypothetical protein